MKRIGLVGCGTHASWAVVPAIRGAADRWQLTAVADVDPGRLAAIEAGEARRFDDHRRMLAEARLDAVYVATLPDTHAAIALNALAAGAHVVCEKPMATTAADCRAVRDAAARAGRLVAVNFETRYHAEHRQVRRWIAEGRLGRIQAAHVQHFWDGHKHAGALGARRKRLTDLSGALDCGIHKADLLRYFCGGAWRLEGLCARGRWFGEDVAYPPHIAILAELDSGVLATLAASFAYGAAMKPRAYSDALTLVGTHGVVNHFEDRLGPSVVHLHSDSLVASQAVEDIGHAGVMTALLRDFADAIDGRPAPAEMATADDGVAAQEFVEAANRQAVAWRRDRDDNEPRR